METKSLLTQGEHDRLECKKAEGGVPRSMWETYSSMANTHGGTILLGVEEQRGDKPSLHIVGVSNPEKMVKEIWDTVNSDKVSDNVLTNADVAIENFEGKSVVVVHVPRASSQQRPIYINGNVMRGTYRRNHEGDYHCSESEVRAMLRDSDKQGNDGVIIEHYGLDDIDPATLTAYRNRFSVYNTDHVWNDDDNRQFLINLGGYAIDRNTGQEGVTLAGLLMFGRGLPIRERFDNFRMDYIDVTNLLPGSRWSDRLTYDGRWENNLYNFFTRVQAKITADVKRPFSMQGITRIDDTPVHKALREALTNAIIHADYFVPSGVLRVEKRDNEFFFSNPGTLKLSVEDLFRGGVSLARNPRMQNMLRMVGFGENLGSGFPTIVKTWSNEHWLRPRIEERLQLQTVSLTLTLVNRAVNSTDNPNESQGDDKNHTNKVVENHTQNRTVNRTVNRTINLTDNPIDDQRNNDKNHTQNRTVNRTVNHTQNRTVNRTVNILNLIDSNNTISITEMARRLGVARSTLARQLKDMQEQGLLQRVGADKNGHWEIVGRR